VADALAQGGWTLDNVCPENYNSDPEVQQITQDALLARAHDIEYFCAGLLPVTAEFIEKAVNLKIIARHGVGYDKVDVAAATRRNIPVTNTPGTNANSVVELCIGLLVCLARHVCKVHAAIMAGGWERCIGTEIEGKTLGIIGLGDIGGRLAIKAKALGMKILANDIQPKTAFANTHGIAMCPLPKLLAESDYVSLHIWGGRDNYHFIAEKDIKQMRREAYLLNLARGDVLDLDALARVMAQGHLAGATLDVFEEEPLARTHPIFDVPNVIFTPHLGAYCTESQARMGLMDIDNFAQVRAGKRPKNIVNPEIYD
jgi:D-3-phosphoglycerate dehydrogenase